MRMNKYILIIELIEVWRPHAWTNVDQDLECHMVSPVYNELLMAMIFTKNTTGTNT